MSPTEQLIAYSQRHAERIAAWAKKVSLPFLDGVPVYNVSMFFWRSIIDGSLTTRASAIAFNFFIALFPAIIFLFTLIPYVPVHNFQEELFELIESLLPGGAFDAIEDTVSDIIMQPRGTLLSLGFVFALVFSTNGIVSMMTAFDATVHSIKGRSWISQRVTAVLLLFILTLLLTIAIVLITFGQLALNYLVDHYVFFDWITYYVLSVGKWLIIIALFFFAFSFLYYLAPAKKSEWRFISAGGTLATVLSIITLIGFTFYINNFNQYNKLYGSIGTLLVVLLLIYFFSLILLVGFELNASIYEAQQENNRPESLLSRLRRQVKAPVDSGGYSGLDP
jgi:membrane protein